MCTYWICIIPSGLYCKLTKLPYVLCSEAFKLSNNKLRSFTSQANQNVQTTRPGLFKRLFYLFLFRDFHLTCFGGFVLFCCFFFLVSGLRTCICLETLSYFEIDTVFTFFTVEKNYAHIWQTLDWMQMHRLSTTMQGI